MITTYCTHHQTWDMDGGWHFPDQLYDGCSAPGYATPGAEEAGYGDGIWGTWLDGGGSGYGPAKESGDGSRPWLNGEQ